jgi:hypothetical protein
MNYIMCFCEWWGKKMVLGGTILPMLILEEVKELVEGDSCLAHDGFQCAASDLTVIWDSEATVRWEFMTENNVAARLMVRFVANFG